MPHNNPEVLIYEEILASRLLPVGFVREYRMQRGSTWRHHISLDFAHVEAKVNIELDGSEHYLSSQSPQLRQSDIERDAWLRQQGWKVIRVRVYTNVLYAFMIDSDVLAELRQIKKCDGIPVSEIIRRGIEMWLESKNGADVE